MIFIANILGPYEGFNTIRPITALWTGDSLEHSGYDFGGGGLPGQQRLCPLWKP